MVEPRSAAVRAPIRPRSRAVGAAGLLAVLAVLALASCSKTSEQASEPAKVTSDGYTIEPPGEVGPDAFTAPFTNDASICDKQQFLRSLQSNPDAYREWARVLGIAPDDVPAYVETLTPIVLTSDTKVTNHGLRDGKAYARKSLLQAGTAVLIDPSAGGTVKQVVSSTTTSTAPSTTTSTTRVTTTSTTSTPGTTPPGVAPPVTRCRCGNPLLPPGDQPPGTTPGTTAPGTTTVSTTSPPVSRQPTTTTPIRSSTTTSTTPPSSTTTTPAASTTTTPSSSTSRVIVTTTTTNAATPIRDVRLGFAARWLRAG